jgi:hypothetical protein
VNLTIADAVELAEALPLTIELEPYRERLSPLAVAVLQGESRRTIDRRRELVLPEVWDSRLQAAALDGISKLRTELERKLGVLQLARTELERPARQSKLARQIIERVLTELLESNDQNIAALEELERELEDLRPEDRASRAAAAARGAYTAARIPRNELRAAIVRTARATDRRGLHNDDTFEHAAVLMAEALATDERRAAVRGWVNAFAEGSSEHVPLLAQALHVLAVESAASDPGSDLIWIQACLGLTLEAGMASS